MPHPRQHTGQIGEAAVCDYLTKQGYEILATNWHAGRWGEIDIIATQDNEIIFIEVKTRRGIKFGYPEEAVNHTKQQKLIGAAQAYLLAHPHLPQKPRFDVAAVLISSSDEIADIKLYQGLTFA